MNRCWLGLGGNVGDVVATLDAAVEAIDAHPQIAVHRLSRVFETAPVGADAGGRFLNAAAGVDTDLSPEELLHALKAIERSLGRTEADRWSARIIDIDLLLFGSSVIDKPQLSVPHPHLWYRRFVLDPLIEIAPDVVHPKLDETLGQLRSWLLARPLVVTLSGGTDENQRNVIELLDVYRPSVHLHRTVPAESEQSPASAGGEGFQLVFLDVDDPERVSRRRVELKSLPGTLCDAVSSVMTAALDEPRVHSRRRR